jgi:Leucine-rich repeat (LRR) protein
MCSPATIRRFRAFPTVLLVGLTACFAGCEKPAETPGPEVKAATPPRSEIQPTAVAAKTPAADAKQNQRSLDHAPAVDELKKLGCILSKNEMGLVIKADCKAAELNDAQAKNLEGLPSLEILSLENAKITNEGLASVSHNTHLRVLSLRRCNQLTDEGLAALEGLDALENLLLLYTNLTDAAMTHVARIKSLRALDLRGCLRMGDGALEQIKNLTNLVDLKIRTNGVTDAGLAHLAGLKLRTFEIEDANQITDEGLKNFAGMTDLTKINLMRVRIGDAGLKNFENCKKLKDVRLRGTSVDGSGLASLHGSKDTLKYLDISETAFGSAAMDNVVPFSNLETLDMWFATIEDADLAKLSGMTKLKQLTLEQCGSITTAGIEHVAKLPALESLNLNQTRIDDAALELLAKVANLKSLDLKNTSVSDDAIEKFKAAKPDCTVNY